MLYYIAVDLCTPEASAKAAEAMTSFHRMSIEGRRRSPRS